VGGCYRFGGNKASAIKSRSCKTRRRNRWGVREFSRHAGLNTAFAPGAPLRQRAGIARWLEEQAELKSVIYPGLKSHPQHDLGSHQFVASVES